MFGRTTPDAVRLPYRHLAKPGVRLLRETVTAIDPVARAVTTDAGVHEADHLVVALGADYDFDATPGPRRLDRVLFRGGRRAACRAPARSSRGAAPWWACAARRTSARRHRARRRSSCTTTSSEGASAPTARSRRGAVSDADPAVAEHVRRAAPGLRRARHRVRAGPPGRLARRRPERRRPRRRDGGAVRPVPRRAEAPRARRRHRERDGRRRLHPGRRARRSRRGFRTCMRSATSPRSGRPRRASSRSARRGSSPAR